MKTKFFSGLLLTAIVLLWPAAASAADVYKDNILFSDNFESYQPKTQVPSTGNVYMGLNDKTSWAGNAATVEADTAVNQAARLSDTGTSGMSKSFDFSHTGSVKMRIQIQVKPGTGTARINLQGYAPAPTQNVYPVSFIGGRMSCFGQDTGLTVPANQWTELEIQADYEANRVEVLVGNKSFVQTSVYLRKPTFVVLSFQAVLAAGQEVRWDDVTVTEMLDSPYNLAELADVHPRLFLNADDFEKAKKLAAGELAEEWQAIKRSADTLAEDEEGPPAYYEDANSEQLWIRAVADNLKLLTLVYKISGETKYKEAADRWFEQLASYPSWGSQNHENNDLACAHALLGIACYYDWLYQELPEARRQEIVNLLIQRGGTMARAGGWWRAAYLQNHMWVSMGGLMAAAAAIYNVYAPAVDWFGTAKTKYMGVFRFLGENSDGASHEGILYWTYGMRFMSYYLTLAKDFLNLDYSDHSYLKNGSQYISQMMIADSYSRAGFMVFSYGDTNATSRYSAEFIPCLAFLTGYTQDKEGQWFVNRYREAVNDNTGNRLLSDLFLFYDDSLDTVSPQAAGRATDELFDHLGIFFSRTGWGDDVSMVAYRCGAVFGEELALHPFSYDLGIGHNHGDINAPWIYSRGDVMLAESGYAIRESDSHNTLLVNGMGQDRSNATAIPRILKIESGDGYAYSVADGTEAYPREAGLLKFQRHFIYLKPDILILVDDVETEEQEEAIPLQLRFFPTTQTFTENKGDYLFENANSRLRISPIPLETGVTVSCGEISRGTVQATGISIDTEKQKLLQPTVLSWSDKDRLPVPVRMERRTDDTLVFYTDRMRAILNVTEQTVVCETIRFAIDEVTLCQNGTPVDGEALTADADLTVQLRAENTTDVDREVTVFLALYRKLDDGTDILAGIGQKQVELPRGVNGTVETNIRLSLNGLNPSEIKARAFVWEDARTLKPLY